MDASRRKVNGWSARPEHFNRFHLVIAALIKRYAVVALGGLINDNGATARVNEDELIINADRRILTLISF